MSVFVNSFYLGISLKEAFLNNPNQTQCIGLLSSQEDTMVSKKLHSKYRRQEYCN